MVCVDAQSGRELAEIRMKDFDFFLTNERTPYIYAASSVGRIVCLQQLGAGLLKPGSVALNSISK